MKNDITRKQFLHLGIGASAAVLVGCGGDDGDTGAGTDDPSTTVSTTDPSSSTDPSTTASTTDPSTSTDPSTTDPSTSTDPATTDPSTSTDTDPSADSSSSDGGSSTTGDAFDCSVDPMVIIGANHMHTLTVTAAEIAAGAEITYDIQGTSPHPHTVTLTAADFATLMSEGQVQVDSSDAGHVHTITVTCL